MKSKIRIWCFIIIIFVPSIAWGVIRVAFPDVYASLQVNLDEKRQPTQIESVSDILKSGSVLSDYYADRAPFRNIIISFYQKYDAKTEEPYEKVIKPTLLTWIYGGSTDRGKNVSTEAFDSLFATGENEAGGESENTPQNVEESTPTHQHTYEEIERHEPDCVNAGYVKKRCTSCGEEVEEMLPASGHQWKAVNVTEASYLNYGYTDYKCTVCEEEQRTDYVDKLVDDSYMAPQILGGATIIGRYDWLFLSGYGNLPYYKATNLLTEEEMQGYLEKIQALQDICDAKGMELAIFYTPCKEQVYAEYMPSFAVETEYKRTARLVDYVKANSSVVISYPLEELKASDRYFQTYLKYDTHWNTMGAFIGTQALYQAMGMEVTSPLSLEVTEIPYTLGGDLIALGGLDQANYPDDVEYEFDYKPEIEILSHTEGDIHAKYIYKTESTCDNGKKLVFLGDSYRCSMIPYLSKDFTKCVILHRDYIESVVKDIKDCNVLVVSAGERYDYRIFPVIDRLIEILSES